jgi:hypothetical protein
MTPWTGERLPFLDAVFVPGFLRVLGMPGYRFPLGKIAALQATGSRELAERSEELLPSHGVDL